MWSNFLKALFIGLTLGACVAYVTIFLLLDPNSKWSWAVGMSLGFALLWCFLDTPWEPFHPRSPRPPRPL